MKHLDKIGFTSLLIGTAGMPESYMIPKQIAICMILIIIGCLLILIGDIHNDIKNGKNNSRRLRDIYHRNASSRPYYLRH